MAAILQLRRGTTAAKPTLFAGEMYVNTTSQSLQVSIDGSTEITLAKLNSVNSGSFNVSGDITLGGTITIGDNTSDNIVINADLSSSIIPNNDNSFDLGSTTFRYRTVNATSISGAIASTNGVISGSSQLTLLNAFTASANGHITDINTKTGSFETKFISIGASTSSLNSFTSSAAPRLTNLETTSASVNISVTNLNSYSASVSNSIGAINIFTASNSNVSLNAATSSYETKGRGIISGSSQLSGTTITDLTVVNLTTVNETASVIFSSGSNRFGDAGNDVHSFTGSVQISGSTIHTGSVIATNGFTGSLFGTASFALNGSSNATLVQSSAASVWTFNHFLATLYPVIQVYDNTNSVIIPQSIVSNDSSSLTITFSSARTGVAVASKGGYVGSAVGTATVANALTTARLINGTSFDGTQNITIPNLVSGSSQVSITGTSDYSGLFGGIGASTASLNAATASFAPRITNLETTSASVNISVTNLNTYSASVSNSIGAINLFSASQITKNTTLATYTGSVDTKFTTLATYTSSLNVWTSSVATTGSNTFIGNEVITGSLTVTGSVKGNVVPITIASLTASLDMNLGSYFTLTLANTVTTHIRATNIAPGMSATLLITTGTNSTASLSPLLLQPSGSAYSASIGVSKKDVLSLVSFDSTNMYVVSTKAMQ